MKWYGNIKLQFWILQMLRKGAYALPCLSPLAYGKLNNPFFRGKEKTPFQFLAAALLKAQQHSAVHIEWALFEVVRKWVGHFLLFIMRFLKQTQKKLPLLLLGFLSNAVPPKTQQSSCCRFLRRILLHIFPRPHVVVRQGQGKGGLGKMWDVVFYFVTIST